MLTLLMLGGLLGTFLIVDAVVDDDDDCDNDDNTSRSGGNGGNGGGSANGLDYTGDDTDEVVEGTEFGDTVETAGGDDFVEGLAGNDVLSLGSGSDVASGGAGNDTIDTGEGDDIGFGDTGKDTINLGPGNDFSFGSDVLDMLEGRDAFDAFSALDGETLASSSVAGDDEVKGGEGDDSIVDLHGANTLYGNDGDDRLTSVDAAGTEDATDDVRGGAGDDVLFVDDGDQVKGGEGLDEYVTWFDEIDDAAVRVTDYEIGEPISILIDPDLLSEEDSLEPVLTKVDGEDAISISVAGYEMMVVEGPTEVEQVEPFLVVSDGQDTPSGLEYVGDDSNEFVEGTEFADTIETLGGDDSLLGQGGNDVLDAGEGDDFADGGAGDDTIDTGAGNDTGLGGLGDDSITLGADDDISYGDDVLEMLNNPNAFDTFRDLDGDTLAASSVAGNDDIAGGEGNDNLVDLHGTNILNGDAGEDTLTSIDASGTVDSADTVLGGADDDILQVDDGDTVSGGEGVDSYTVWFDEIDDTAVRVTDYQIGEEVRILIDADLLSEEDSLEPVLTKLDGVDAVSISVAGYEMMVVEGPTSVDQVDGFVLVTAG